ncbi:ABC transporter permease [Acholeplasma granularum]|uniref:ABC transporter permease n=1 Tax=Acholeplasma granularum TaxID=264635 RepID=UPI0004B931EC|nr:iron chelate uptake ABC transporter family permease subunit [Acholeplasma granularum]
MILKKRSITIVLLFIFIILSLSIDARKDVNLITLFSFTPEVIEILLISRIPRTLTIILTSSALSVAGLIMQSIAKNKFASPGVMGTTQAATLGVLVAHLFFPGQDLWVQFIFSFVTSMISSYLFLSFLNKIQFKNEVYVPLIGMMFGALISSIAIMLAQTTNALQFLNSIGVGSFTNKTLGTFEMILFVVPALILSIIYASEFNIISLGKDFSENLGLNYKKTITIGIIIVSVITASSFIVVGPLPFLGLIIPNLVSIYYGDNLKKSIFDLMIFGSLFVLICDILARSVLYIITGYNFEIAVGFVMGILGSIIFLYLLLRKTKDA